MTKMVRKFDMYAKVKEEYKLPAAAQASSHVNTATWCLIGLLTLSECWAYATSGRTKEHMVVDSTLGQKLRINMNITFPALSCSEVHVDAMDVAGDYHPYMEQNMMKQRLHGVTGLPVGRKVEETANVFENKAFQLPEDYCGSCYGAEEKARDCCNTCEQVVARYSVKGWSTKEIRRSAEQCKREMTNPLASAQPGEGCRLSGFILVNKVAGNFHVALGESVVRDGRFIHQFQPQDAPGFNASHVVHSLSFGEPYPGMRADPMDGVSAIATEDHGTGLYQYFIKLVPTIYESPKSGDTFWTNQYSYTQRFRPLAAHLTGKRTEEPPHAHHAEASKDHHAHGTAKHSPVATSVLPGVFWVYDLSAFMLELSPTSTSTFAHFLARLCAIAGGAFTVMGLVESAFGHARKSWASVGGSGSGKKSGGGGGGGGGHAKSSL